MKRRHFLKALAAGLAATAIGIRPKALVDDSNPPGDMTPEEWELFKKANRFFVEFEKERRRRMVQFMWEHDLFPPRRRKVKCSSGENVSLHPIRPGKPA